MSRLLVTGGAGFIGSNFVHYWRKEHPGDRLVVLDALTSAGNLANLGSLLTQLDLRFIHGSIRDDSLVERLLRDEQIDTVVHFAAQTQVEGSAYGEDALEETNVAGTHSLLRSAHKVWLEWRAVDRHRFHYVSTEEVYGSVGLSDERLDERAPYAPNSFYAASKAASDQIVRAYYHTYGLQATSGNCSRNYGPYHFPEKLIPEIIVNILHGRTLRIHRGGRNIRNWLHVIDHCRAIDLILAKGRPGEVYNISGRSESDEFDLAQRLCQIANEAFRDQPELKRRHPECPAARGGSTMSLIEAVPHGVGRERRYAIGCDKIERDLGYRPRISLEKGLRDTFAWYLQHEGWWRDVMDGSYQKWILTHFEQ